MILLKRFLPSIFACTLIVVPTACSGAVTTEDGQAAPMSGVQSAEPSPRQLQQLVAPIALYPDELVAEVLAASTYPTEVVQANRWLQQHSTLKDQQLGTEVDKQPWDASVKALTEFPSVLANMDKNLSWTSALGDAYYNQPQEVMDAVQVMRKRAETAGTLKTSQQQTVTTQGNTIVIEPFNPQVVYVPTYDPWVVYGAPVAIYPGYVDYYVGPFVSFGFGYPIGFFPYPWGWGFWSLDWNDRFVAFNHARFVSHSRVFFDHDHGFAHRGDFHGFHSGEFHGNEFHGFHGAGSEFDHRTARGFAAPHVAPGDRTGAFSGLDHGGRANTFSGRGQSSFGGGFHGGFNGAAPGGFRGAMHGSGFNGGAPHGSFGGGGFHGGGAGHR